MYTDRGAHDHKDVGGRATHGAVAEDVRERSLCMEKVRPGTGREAGLGHAPVSRSTWMCVSDHCAWMHRCRGAHGCA
jgi:hypothetical protein